MRPLEGLLVLDFSIFLSGPSAALRLADLGARVIKVERPDGGDLCRQLYISELELDGESTLFHSINRNKESFAANLKDPADLATVRELIAQADVLVSNFRPGVMTSDWGSITIPFTRSTRASSMARSADTATRASGSTNPGKTCYCNRYPVWSG